MSPTGIGRSAGAPEGSRRVGRQLDRLAASSYVEAAAWVLIALRDFDGTVGSIVPPVFEAYARVFHPASRGRGDDEVVVRWTDVAGANEREMHAAAEWGSITGSLEHQHRSTQPELWDSPPSTGELPHEVARQLVAILSEHTECPDHGYFAVWEGWGRGTTTFFCTEDTPQVVRERAQEAYDAEVAAWHGLIDSAAVFQVPHRRMHLLSGALAAIDDFYEHYAGPNSLCLRNPPSLWWPADDAWCVGTDIDLMTTYVGGSSAAIDALLVDDQFEALPVSDSQRVTWDADKINPLPASP